MYPDHSHLTSLCGAEVPHLFYQLRDTSENRDSGAQLLPSPSFLLGLLIPASPSRSAHTSTGMAGRAATSKRRSGAEIIEQDKTNKPRHPTAISPQIEFELPSRRGCAQTLPENYAPLSTHFNGCWHFQCRRSIELYRISRITRHSDFPDSSLESLSFPCP